MSEGSPYDKAIEESAKAANNAVDLIREGGRAIGPAVGDIYGLLIGDKVRAARIRNLDEINRKRQRKLEERGVEYPLHPPEDIAIPILEAAQGETRDEMQELWARLLANAMDPARANNVRPEFIETVRQLQPIDAQILTLAMDRWDLASITDKRMASSDVISPDSPYRESAVKISFAHLHKLGCVTRSDARLIEISDYGQELMYGLKP